jgi:hypothetical protein
VAVQDETDETGDAGHAPDSKCCGQDWWQVRARRRHLDHDPGDDAYRPADDDGDRKPPAPEERQREGDSHHRDSAHGRDRGRDRGRNENEDEHDRDEQGRRPPAITAQRLTPTLEQQSPSRDIEPRRDG